jgi:hypothetical protein
MKSERCAALRCKKPAREDGLCRTHFARRADREFSLEIRERDGRCMAGRMGGRWPEMMCNGGLQAAHLISRRYQAPRHEPSNCVALCAAHHRWLDLHPEEKTDICRAWLGVTEYEVLRQLALGNMRRIA